MAPLLATLGWKILVRKKPADTRTHIHTHITMFLTPLHNNYPAVCNYIELYDVCTMYPVGERRGIPWAALASF